MFFGGGGGIFISLCIRLYVFSFCNIDDFMALLAFKWHKKTIREKCLKWPNILKFPSPISKWKIYDVRFLEVS